MFNYIKRLFSTPKSESRSLTDRVEVERVDAASIIYGGNGTSFDISEKMIFEECLPLPDWMSLTEWIESIDINSHGRAWADAELAWLSCMCRALGETYKLSKFRRSVVLSSLSLREEKSVISFMDSSLKKILQKLGKIAAIPEWGYDILIIFDDENTYYRYISRYYPEEGEFSLTSGLYISHGCGHFVTTKQDIKLIEPVIVHEMTHSCVSYLSIPEWLNEGLAVNIEHSLCGPSCTTDDTLERYNQHRNFWNSDTIQQLWSGSSFKRTDEGSLLSYDLSRILVLQMAKSWDKFEEFVLEADYNDSGQKSANEKYGVTLGAVICALLEKEYSASWEPTPEGWKVETFK